MSLGEWNKKEELVADQALRHLRNYSQMFSAFTTNDRSELALILKIQEYCYDNMNFMNSFYKIMVLFYKRKFLFWLMIEDVMTASVQVLIFLSFMQT